MSNVVDLRLPPKFRQVGAKGKFRFLEMARRDGGVLPMYRLILHEISLKHWRPGGCCWASVSTIAEGVGCSVWTVKRGVSALVKAGYLWRRFRVRQSSQLYLVWPARAVDDRSVRSGT